MSGRFALAYLFTRGNCGTYLANALSCRYGSLRSKVSDTSPPLPSSTSSFSPRRHRHRRFHLCRAAIGNAEDRRVIPGERKTPFCLHHPPWRDLEEGERIAAAGFYGYLSKHFVRGLDTWWIFPGSPSARTGLRHRVATANSSRQPPPLPLRFASLVSSTTEMDQVATRRLRCAGHPLLFEEGISQSNTPDARRTVLARLS